MTGLGQDPRQAEGRKAGNAKVWSYWVIVHAAKAGRSDIEAVKSAMGRADDLRMRSLGSEAKHIAIAQVRPDAILTWTRGE